MHQVARRARYLGGVAALAAVYAGAAALGLQLAFAHGSVSAVWPPTGIALAALVLFGRRWWPGVALGAALACAATGAPAAVAAGIAAGNTLEALGGALLLHRAGVRPALDRWRDAVALVLLAGVLSTTVSATLGIASLAAGTALPSESVVPLWGTWWLGSALGNLVIAPFLLTWRAAGSWRDLARRKWEALALLAALVAAGQLLFAQELSRYLADLRYLVFVLVIWAATRFGPRGAAAATLVVSALAIWGTAHGAGPFAGGGASEDLLHLQAFMAVVALTGLLLAAAGAERAAATAALRQSHAILKAVAEGTTDTVFVKDLQGRYLMVNAAGATFLGASVEQVLGRDDAALVVPDSAAQVLALDQRVVATGRSRTYEHECTVEGLKRTFLTTAGPYRDAHGRVVGLIGIVRDISARKREEEAQRFLARVSAILASSLDYETTLQSIAHLAIPAVADWCIVDVLEQNSQIRRVATAAAGAHQASLLRRLRERYPPTWDSPQPAAVALRTGKAVLFAHVSDGLLETTIRDEAHHALLRQLRPCSTIAVPLVARGHTVGAITLATSQSGRHYGEADLALAEDLAGRCALAVDNARLYAAERDARDEAEQAARLRDEFLSIASHELKTPVTTVRGYAQMMARRYAGGGPVDPAKILRALEAIDREADKLSRLVTQLLDVTRLRAGGLALQRSEVDVGRLARDVVANVQATAAAPHPLAVRVACPEPVHVAADPLRLEQVLVNLLNNAIRYSPDDGEIMVEVGGPAPRGMVRLAVQDRGPGIAPEHRDYIFERFYQANPLGRRAGMGLGLYISRQIVEQHGGRIATEFPPGGGTRFVVTLPA